MAIVLNATKWISIFSTCIVIFLIVFCVLNTCTAQAISNEVVKDGENALINGEYKKAYNLLKDESDKGDPIAQMLIGLMYQYGQYVEKDIIKSEYLLKSSFESKCITAGYMLAKLYKTNNRYTDALNVYHQLKDMGSSQSLFEIGFMYYEGSGLGKDYCKAYEYFKDSIESNDMRSAYYIAMICLEGKCQITDYQYVARCLFLAADNNNAKAQYALGLFFEYGYILKQDKQQALKWYKESARNGFPEAKKRIETINK